MESKNSLLESPKRGSFDDQIRMVLVVGAILLSALGFVVYAFVREPTVLVTNQALTFIIGYYFHRDNSSAGKE